MTTFPQYPPSRDGQSFLALEGSLDAVEAAGLRDKLMLASRGEPHDVVVDLRGVCAISPTALAALVGARARQKSVNRELTLIYRSGSVTDQALAHAGMRGLFLTVRESD